MFDLTLLRPAIRFLEEQGPTDQDEIRRLLDIIAVDPYHDGVHKFAFPIPPVTVSLYHTTRFKIVYHIVDNTSVRIFSNGLARDPTKPCDNCILTLASASPPTTVALTLASCPKPVYGGR